MARKKQEEAPKGSPAWMATFSDLMNLLLCFFVLLFAMSTTDASKFAEMAAYFKDSISFFDGGESSFGEGQLISSGVSQLNNLDVYINDAGKANESDTEEDPLKEYKKELKEQTEKTYDKVIEQAEKNKISDYVKVDMDSNYQYVALSLNGAVLFDSGKADIKDGALPILSRLGDILKDYDKQLIKIEGHTDNVPIKSKRYKNNMDLSTDRALSVWLYLTERKHLDPRTLESSGRGEYNPIADNGTAEGRAKNRRVEILIYSNVE